MLQLNRIYSYLESGRWFRRMNKGGNFSLGGYSYQTCWRWHSRTVEITFDAHIRAASTSVEVIPFPWRKFLYGYSLNP